MYEKLRQLRQLNLQRAETDEMVALLALANGMEATYAYFSIPAPEWLALNIVELKREIQSRHRDMLEARLKEVKARRATLATVEEKRKALDDEEARLTAALGSK